MALGLDQIPESLFPLLGCKVFLEVNAEQIVVIVGAFFLTALILSRLLFWLRIRKMANRINACAEQQFSG